jgi:protein arginine kinase activator
MKCELSNKNEATLLVIQISNGIPKEMHICEECAKEDNNKAFDIPLSFQDFFQGILDIISMQSKATHNNSNEEVQNVSCSVCGMTYEEFKNKGRLGCENCYAAFEQLDTIIKNMHGSNKHMGKIPNRGQKDLMLKRKLEILKKNLSEAIKSEEYEDAARIRDEIRAIEKGE